MINQDGGYDNSRSQRKHARRRTPKTSRVICEGSESREGQTGKPVRPSTIRILGQLVHGKAEAAEVEQDLPFKGGSLDHNAGKIEQVVEQSDLNLAPNLMRKILSILRTGATLSETDEEGNQTHL